MVVFLLFIDFGCWNKSNGGLCGELLFKFVLLIVGNLFGCGFGCGQFFVDVGCGVLFWQLFVIFVLSFVDYVVMDDGWVCVDFFGLGYDIFVFVYGQEFGSIVKLVQYKFVVLWLDGYVGDRIIVFGDIWVFGKCFVEYIKLLFGFYGKMIDWVLEFFWCVGVEMFEIVIKIWG